MSKISQSDNPEEFTELPNSWEEKGIKIGIEQGIEQGIERGIERGIEQGIEQGIMQGTEEAKKGIVLEMLKEGLATEFIAKVTQLDKEAIEQLREHN